MLLLSQKGHPIYIYIYICIYLFMLPYIYIERERDTLTNLHEQPRILLPMIVIHKPGHVNIEIWGGLVFGRGKRLLPVCFRVQG